MTLNEYEMMWLNFMVSYIFFVGIYEIKIEFIALSNQTFINPIVWFESAIQSLGLFCVCRISDDSFDHHH